MHLNFLHPQFYTPSQWSGKTGRLNPTRKVDVDPTKQVASPIKSIVGPKRGREEDSEQCKSPKEYPTATYLRNDRPDPSLLPYAKDITLCSVKDFRYVRITCLLGIIVIILNIAHAYLVRH